MAATGHLILSTARRCLLTFSCYVSVFNCGGEKESLISIVCACAEIPLISGTFQCLPLSTASQIAESAVGWLEWLLLLALKDEQLQAIQVVYSETGIFANRSTQTCGRSCLVPRQKLSKDLLQLKLLLFQSDSLLQLQQLL